MHFVALVLSTALFSGAQCASVPSAEAAQKAGIFSIQPHANELPQKPIPMTCTAELYCPSPFDLGPITCQGNTTCQSFYWEIWCDGTRTLCDCSIAPSGCADPFDYCACRHAGYGHAICVGQSC